MPLPVIEGGDGLAADDLPLESVVVTGNDPEFVVTYGGVVASVLEVVNCCTVVCFTHGEVVTVGVVVAAG